MKILPSLFRALLVSGVFTAALLATAARAANIPNLYLHAGTSLNGEWKTIIDPYENGYYDYRWEPRDESSRAEAYFLDQKPRSPSDRVEYDFDLMPSLMVPGDWNTQRKELYYYEGTVWYRRTVDFAGAKPGERVFLRFGAVNYRADVYVNGQKVGTNIGGFTPFSFEVGGFLKTGKNSIIVKADNKRYRDGVPTLNTDWWNYGGLTREVRLVTVPATFIADHRITLESETSRVISGWVQLDGGKEGQSITVSLPELKETATVTADAQGRATFRFTPAKLDLWSPESPKLYTLNITSGAASISERVGFRTVRTRGREILVNGVPTFLRGICIHEEFPLSGGGRVNNAEKARQLLLWAKELGCNFVRLAHYPHNEDMTRLADELGILVWSEVPVYWTINYASEDTYQNAENQLATNIVRDANRASIIIWSLANETPVSELRTRFLLRLLAKARSLDNTRLISAAMEKHPKPGNENVQVVEDPLAEHVDIVAFNQYVGWYDGLPEKCDRVTWEINYNKPIVISEFGGDARQGFHGTKDQRWTEEYQEDLFIRTLAMLDKIEGFSGVAPWILVDFRSPRRTLPGIQDDFNRKGIISSDGVKKKAFFVLSEFYAMKKKTYPVAPAK
jgi:beta-glucuronidase